MLKNFNLNCFLDATNELVRADEVERALNLLDNLPAYYRDFPPIEVIQLKNEIMSRIATPSAYADYEYNLSLDEGKWNMKETLRGIKIIEEVKAFNDKGVVPHIIDYAPGPFWVLTLLKSEGLKFTYAPKPINEKKSILFLKELGVFDEFLKKPESNVPHIFLAFEILEHLWNEGEIKIESLKAGKLPEIIHVSTPQYTFDTECEDWTTRECLGHLRAYTPMEFKRTLEKMFPEYDQDTYSSVIMHARLTLKAEQAP